MKRFLIGLLALLLSLGAGAQYGNFWVTSGKIATSVSASAFPLLAPDGSSAAPSYSFASSTGTGMYWDGSNVNIATGATRYAAFGANGVFATGGTPAFQFGVSGLGLFNEAADTIAQRHGTNAQTFRVYNTFTDASNYERIGVAWSANTAYLLTEAAGTGTGRNIFIRAAGTTLSLNTGGSSAQGYGLSNGHFIALTDNLYDIGASGATRPRSIYAGTSFIAPNSGTSYTFDGSTGTGMNLWAANSFAMNVNGSAYMGFTATGGASARMASTLQLGWSSGDPTATSLDTTLVRDGGAGIVALKNGTQSHKLRIYNTTTGPIYLEINSGTAGWLVTTVGTANQLRMTQTTAPTCGTNCGTSPTIVGSDTAGIVTMGATGAPASGWVLTFNGTWNAAPSCQVQSALGTMVVGKMPIAVATTTTTMTVTTNGTAPANSDKYTYHCFGVS